MAAPCCRLIPRLLSVPPGLRRLSGGPVCRPGVRPEATARRAGSSWSLAAAVCVQRPPVISADRSPTEQRFARMLQQLELEKSLLSDHELRLLEDAERLRRRQADDYDSDEEDERRDQDIVLTQDLEDSWDQRLRAFQPEPRVKGDVDEDVASARRHLSASLVLLTRRQVGADQLWLLPQTAWREGETLRQTAERALAALPGELKATFLGNAPCGVYKSKAPRASASQSSVGTKLFFFRAVLTGAAAPDASLAWLKTSELRRYLSPAYGARVQRFISGL